MLTFVPLLQKKMKIFAVGMNYIQHNKELDGALYKPEKPVIFTKADSALLKDHKPFFIPDWSQQVDYETEVVVRICRLGKSIPERFAHRYYDAVTVGNRGSGVTVMAWFRCTSASLMGMNSGYSIDTS